MPTLRLVVRSRRDADDALSRLLDPAVHTAAIPLTVVTGSMAHPGDRFVARTTLGPLGFDDTMVVRGLEATGEGARGVIGKTGRVVRGEVRFAVVRDGAGSVVEWEQDIAIAGLPRLLDPVVAGVARVAYRVALRRIVG